jgi:hypothetical protein
MWQVGYGFAGLKRFGPDMRGRIGQTGPMVETGPAIDAGGLADPG